MFKNNLFISTVILIVFSIPNLSFSAEKFIWEGKYEMLTDGGGSQVVTIKRNSSGKLGAIVNWYGRGTSGAVLYCDVVVSKDNNQVILIYSHFESDPNIPVVEFNFQKGKEYLSIKRVKINGKYKFIPSHQDWDEQYFEKTG